MCLISKDIASLTAKDDIPCLKVVRELNGKFLTPLMNYDVTAAIMEKGEIKAEDSKDIEDSTYYEYVGNGRYETRVGCVLDKGFIHSYVLDWKQVYVIWASFFTRYCPNGEIHVLLCRIPKGEEYYHGTNSDYASGRIVVDKDVTEWFGKFNKAKQFEDMTDSEIYESMMKEIGK